MYDEITDYLDQRRESQRLGLMDQKPIDSTKEARHLAHRLGELLELNNIKIPDDKLALLKFYRSLILPEKKEEVVKEIRKTEGRIATLKQTKNNCDDDIKKNRERLKLLQKELKTYEPHLPKSKKITKSR